MTETTQQRIERIAEMLSRQPLPESTTHLKGIIKEALTAFAEEQKGEQEQFKQFILTELDKIYHVKAGTNAERIAAAIIHAIHQRYPNQSTLNRREA